MLLLEDVLPELPELLEVLPELLALLVPPELLFALFESESPQAKLERMPIDASAPSLMKSLMTHTA